MISGSRRGGIKKHPPRPPRIWNFPSIGRILGIESVFIRGVITTRTFYVTLAYPGSHLNLHPLYFAGCCRRPLYERDKETRVYRAGVKWGLPLCLDALECWNWLHIECLEGNEGLNFFYLFALDSFCSSLLAAPSGKHSLAIEANSLQHSHCNPTLDPPSIGSSLAQKHYSATT